MTDRTDSIEQSVSSITTSLLNSAKQGDQDAWRRLERVYRRLIAWWCLRGGVAAQDVDDLVQEVLAAVAQAFPSYEHRSFRGFLWKITSNKIRDYWRSRRREPVVPVEEIDEVLKGIEARTAAFAGSVDTGTRILFEAVVHMVRSEMTERDWQIFWDYAVDGKSASVVAASYNVSRNVVFLTKSRTLRRIRAELGVE